jgi:hypothetical protein
MNRINALLFEKYITQVVGEAKGRGLEALFDPMPAKEVIKFGKYKIVNNKAVVKVKFQEALDKKYISNVTINGLNELIKVGFKFNNVYFVEEYDGYYPNSISTLVLGEDPEGKPIVYVRKAGSQSGPKMYYETEYGDVHVYYQKFSTNTSITIEDILNAAVSGRKWIARNDGSGTIDTKGNVDLNSHLRVNKFRNADLKDIPVKFGIVNGDINVELNEITVSNLPRAVYGSVNIHSNSLESLIGGIETVRGDRVAMTAPKLLTLEGFPKVTKSNIDVTLNRMNSLTSLKGLPETVQTFSINEADVLLSLYGAPSRVIGNENDYSAASLYKVPLIKTLEYFPETDSHTHISVSQCNGLISLKGMSGVARSIQLAELPSLVSISHLPTEIEMLHLKSLPKLADLKDLSGKSINEILIYNLPSLKSLHGLPEDLKSLRLFCEDTNIQNLIGCPDNLKSLHIESLGRLRSLRGMPLNVEDVKIISKEFSNGSFRTEQPEGEDLKILIALVRSMDKVGPNLQKITYGCPNSYDVKNIDRNFIVRHSQEVQDILNKDNPGIEMDI